MDEDRTIDRIRYPHFAALADDAIWFRNCTSVSDCTNHGVPAILTGNYPDLDNLPTLLDHPRNLFTLLAGSHRLVVSEQITHLYQEPQDEATANPTLVHRVTAILTDLSVIYLHSLLPGPWQGGIPPLTQGWKDFGRTPDTATREGTKKGSRKHQFQRYIERISAEDPPTLYFQHLILPHGAFIYYPSGTVFTKNHIEPSGQGHQWGDWGHDETAIIHSWQRHLLQLEFTDNLLGKLLAKLQETGLYDRSLILVTADHGESYWAGLSHRAATEENLGDVLPVPLLCKLPHQQRGRISDRRLETIDILPTIADALSLEIQWPVDGHSGLDTTFAEKTQRTCVAARRFVFSDADLVRQNLTLARKLALFGSGKKPAGLFRVGPYGDLVGHPVSELPVTEESDVWIELLQPELYQHVDTRSDFVPGEIVGLVKGGPATGSTLDLAVAVNGTIQAVTGPYQRQASDADAVWSVLVRENSFRAGNNEIAVYVLDDLRGHPALLSAGAWGASAGK
jgi:hypothetical protein